MKSNEVNAIFFLIGSVHGGGAEKQCLFQAELLAKSGKNVTIFILSPLPLECKLSNQLKIVSICDLSRGNKICKGIEVFKAIFVLRKFLQKAKRPVILYAWLELARFISFFASLFINVKLVWAIRDSNIGSHRHQWKMYLLEKINSMFSRYVDLFVSNSFAGLLFYKKQLHYTITRSIVIDNFIDFYHYLFLSSEQKKIIKKQSGIPEEIKIILTVSRITGKKNLESMIYAVLYLKKVMPSGFKWVHLGTGRADYCIILNKIIRRLFLEEYVCFLGESDRVVDYMQIADLFVLPSLSEGVSNSLLEAIACHTLCISTRVGDSARFLDKKAIIEGFSPELICEKIQWALSMPTHESKEIISFSYHRLTDQCDLEKNEKKLLDLMKDLN